MSAYTSSQLLGVGVLGCKYYHGKIAVSRNILAIETRAFPHYVFSESLRTNIITGLVQKNTFRQDFLDTCSYLWKIDRCSIFFNFKEIGSHLSTAISKETNIRPYAFVS